MRKEIRVFFEVNFIDSRAITWYNIGTEQAKAKAWSRVF